MPRQEDRRELADADERVGEKADDVEQREHDDAQMREPRAASVAESEADPLGASHDSGPPEPDRQEHHEENLIEDGPEPRNPDALEPVDEEQVDQPHGPADVEHAGRVGDAEQVPRDLIAAEEVAAQAGRRALGDPEAEQERGRDVGADDEDVDRVDVHDVTEPSIQLPKLWEVRQDVYGAGRLFRQVDLTNWPIRYNHMGPADVILAQSTDTGRGPSADRNEPHLHQAVQSSDRPRGDPPFGPLSRADVARHTELTGQTVSNLVHELLALGLVREGDARSGGARRALDELEINPNGAYSIGLDLDRDHLTGVLVDLAGQGSTTNPSRGRYAVAGPDLDLMVETAQTLLSRQDIKQENLAGIGIGIPGPMYRGRRRQRLRRQPEGVSRLASHSPRELARRSASTRPCSSRTTQPRRPLVNGGTARASSTRRSSTSTSAAGLAAA